ncbi:YidC/Oxa1 family membrane protein insertase [Ceratocystis lukuohia]|uniref:Mitochondrial inner membrane protein OXA1 n=2 Tax=Ceratocystis TaxID=5157 RepID=A0A0F8B992_CERFI|nr:Mitochondrial inner membrane protein OXA1 [Ceratocystis platani]
MLPSRGAVQSLATARLTSQATLRPQNVRSFGTATLRRTTTNSLQPHSTAVLSHRLRNSSSVLSASLMTTGSVVSGSRAFSWRFWQRSKPAEPAAPTEVTTDATTTAATATPADAAASSAAAASEPTSAADAVAAATTTDPTVTSAAGGIDSSLLDLETILNMPETIGYLEKLGLNFGWGPSSMVQWLLEHVHVYSGLPWWGTIFVAQLIVRLLLFKPLLISHETSTRMQVLRKTNPEYEAALRDFRDGLQRAQTNPRCKEEAMLARQTYLSIEKEHGIRKMNMAWGMLQIPIGIGFYRVLNAMAQIPVPALESGGVAWFHDLATADPLYILPLAGPAMMLAAMTANAKFMPAEQRKSTKVMAMVLMPVSAIFTCWLPSAVQWYFFCAALFGAIQNVFIAQPWGRRILGLPAMPEITASNPATTPLTSVPSGANYQAPRMANIEPEKAQDIVSELKGGFNTMLQKGKDTMDRRTRKQEISDKLDREAKIQDETWEALRARMAAKEKEARSRGRRF